MNVKDLFESWKFIIIISVITNIIFILIGTIWFDNNYLHLELSALLPLSLLLGPISILGFSIAEVLYWVLFLGMNDPLTILLSGSSLFVLGIFPWKFWYLLRYKKDFEVPNMNSFNSLIKIIFIIFIMIFQTYLFSNLIFNRTIDLGLESYYMIFVLGIILLLLGMGVFGKYNIATYPPNNLKSFIPGKYYDLAFIISILLSLATLRNPNNGIIVLILILSGVFLMKPFGEDVFKIDNTLKITTFYKAFLTIFIILIIIPTILSLSFTMTGSFEEGITTGFLNYLEIISGFFLAILIPLIIYMLFLEKQVINPINQLSTYLSEEINGDSDLKTLVDNLNSITVNNEIKLLSQSLLNMEKESVDYTNNLLKVTKEKERYETELKLAHEIQYSMIPTDFEEFYKNNGIKLWGSMKAARDVGGDFYDYFRIDEENIGFVIGDVSGKGVSTALIMVKVMTLIRDYTTYYEDISDVLNEVNNELCKDNVEGLLVSCWLGKLNIKTRELSYVSAGHKQPLIRHDDDFEFINITPGVFLAIMENICFEKHSIQLEPEDTLFLYTDGITDANDGYNKFYGNENLQKILNQNKDNELDTIIKSIENDIEEFSNGQELFDDISMLIIKMN